MISAEKYFEIACKFGTPVYIFDESEFQSNYHCFVKCFQESYPRYRLSYSFKTNYTPYICKLIKNNGGYAEVVSDMEYTLAKKLGFGAEKIVYNGPAKGPQLEEHLKNGGINNIDNLAEAERICRLADENPDINFKTGIRINMNLGRGTISRFGIEPFSEELKNCVQMLRKRENVSINGIHCHLSHARDIEAWEKRTDIMLKVADELFSQSPEYISLGSGMFGRMDDAFAQQFNCHIPSYSEYAKVTVEKIAKHYSNLKADEMPIVFTEPGATVISKYVSFLTQIVGMKKTGDRQFAVCNGSMYNIGEVCLKKNLPITVINNGLKPEHTDVDIVGYTCLEYDKMYRDYSGKISNGSLIAFGNVGGYSIVSKPQFIQENCAMLAVDAGGEVKEIMRKETFDDVFAKFMF